MGALVHDNTALAILVQINARFGAGEPIEELVGLQEEFKIFSSKRQLRKSFALLNIVPPPGNERERWYNYLDHLHKVPSDRAGVNGHDRIMQVIENNLESANPFPMRLTAHSANDNPEVTAMIATPIIFSKQKYVVVSVPTKAGREVRQAIAEQVRARRKQRKARKR
jgi:hypothetical protein